MPRGDHIYVRRTVFQGIRVGELTLYAHHGVDMGDGTVIDYASANGTKRWSIVTRRTMEEFAQCDRVETVEYGIRLDPEETAARAEFMLGKDGYDFFSNNCEHFATWCVTGQAESTQIEKGVVSTGVAVSTYAVPSLGVAAITELGQVAIGSAPNVMSGLCTVGGSAVGGIAVLGAASGVAGVGLTRALLRDKPHLPEKERDARRSGREASIAGAVVGTASAVYAVGALGFPGYSAAGISSGLAAIGRVTGGGMLRGVATTGALPFLAALILGYIFERYRLGSSRA